MIVLVNKSHCLINVVVKDNKVWIASINTIIWLNLIEGSKILNSS